MKIYYNFNHNNEEPEEYKKRRYLYRILPEFLQENGVISSINEMQVYFVAPNLACEKDYKIPASFLQKLPRVRFTKNRTHVFIDKLFLGKNGDGLPTIENILFEFSEVFKILELKKKAGDDFNTDKILKLLPRLAQELAENLDFYNEKAEQIICQELIQRAKKDRQERQQNTEPATRLIRDIRLCYKFEAKEITEIHKYFSPYNIRICEKILDKLREKKFRLPGYDHLYIQASESFEKALSCAIRAERWLVYGISVLEDPLSYQSLSAKEQEKMVFCLIKQGLLDIAKVDSLDMAVLNEALDSVEKSL